MVKAELIRRSPLRIFEKSLHGGVGAGKIGVLSSRKGVGKTACLVHIATDKLLNGKNVIHVSFSAKVDHIVTWYEDIFKEIAKKRELEYAVDVYEEIVKNRVIMNFSQKGCTAGQVIKSLTSMITDGGFNADTIIVDGFDFTQTSIDDLRQYESFAEDKQLEIWFANSLRGEEPVVDENHMPFELKPYLEQIECIVFLQYKEDYIGIEVVKDHDTVNLQDMQLKLDPKTLLIVEE